MNVVNQQQALTKETRPYNESMIAYLCSLDGNKYIKPQVTMPPVDCYRVAVANQNMVLH